MTNVNEVSSPVLVMRNDRLKVEVATPRGNIQCGTRFDLTGHVIQVTLDGRHTFCVPEAFNENRDTGGLGLCNEFTGFGCRDGGPPEPGTPYPKFGIGILEDTGEGEGLFAKRIVREPFPIYVTGAGVDPDIEDTMEFTVEPVSCGGCAMRLRKTLRLDGSSLHIGYEAENTGDAVLRSAEYNHNFVQVDGHDIGPDYKLSFPYRVEQEKAHDICSVSGNSISIREVPKDSFICFLTGCREEDHSWELLHIPSGVGMREYDDFMPYRVILWGRRHVISPEIYNSVELKPGQIAAWNRRYEFFTRGA